MVSVFWYPHTGQVKVDWVLTALIGVRTSAQTTMLIIDRWFGKQNIRPSIGDHFKVYGSILPSLPGLLGFGLIAYAMHGHYSLTIELAGPKVRTYMLLVARLPAPTGRHFYRTVDPIEKMPPSSLTDALG